MMCPITYVIKNQSYVAIFYGIRAMPVLPPYLFKEPAGIFLMHFSPFPLNTLRCIPHPYAIPAGLKTTERYNSKLKKPKQRGWAGNDNLSWTLKWETENASEMITALQRGHNLTLYIDYNWCLLSVLYNIVITSISKL